MYCFSVYLRSRWFKHRVEFALTVPVRVEGRQGMRTVTGIYLSWFTKPPGKSRTAFRIFLRAYIQRLF